MIGVSQINKTRVWILFAFALGAAAFHWWITRRVHPTSAVWLNPTGDHFSNHEHTPGDHQTQRLVDTQNGTVISFGSSSDGQASSVRTANGTRRAQTTKKLIDTSKLGKEEGYKLILRSMRDQSDFLFVEKYESLDQWLSNEERDILKDRPVRNLSTVASHLTSILHVLPGPEKGQLSVGDTLTLRVDLYDARGRQVQKGGHEVRVWMASNDSPVKSAAAYVTDMRNGSYLASLPVLWSGQSTVHAALVRTREFLRYHLHLLQRMVFLFRMSGAFVKGYNQQATLCMPVPAVPGFPEVCNVTLKNSGLPWFCGKPSRGNLTCEDWTGIRHLALPKFFPGTSAELKLLKSKTVVKKLISTGKVTAHTGKLPMRDSLCLDQSPRDTWTDQSPRGFWKHQTWRPLSCAIPTVTPLVVGLCLANTSFLSLGDSNARKVWEEMQTLSGCSQGRKPRECANPRLNLTIAWNGHALPYYTGGDHWETVQNQRAPSVFLDQIPSIGKYVIMIHLYGHFFNVHPGIYAYHVRDAARAVRRLLDRNPLAKVFIRGPHAFGGDGFQIYSDSHAHRCLQIIKSEFRPLVSRVVLLNAWDMTVAMNNKVLHPPSYVVRSLIGLMLGHVCPRHIQTMGNSTDLS